jgi:hypothetical protein
MKIEVPIDHALAEGFLPPAKPDGSGVGLNYADQLLKPLKLTLADGRKLSAKRRGLKITVSIGERSGEAIFRRLEHGPDEKTIVRRALAEAAGNAGASLAFEPGAIQLEVEETSAS